MICTTVGGGGGRERVRQLARSGERFAIRVVRWSKINSSKKTFDVGKTTSYVGKIISDIIKTTSDIIFAFTKHYKPKGYKGLSESSILLNVKLLSNTMLYPPIFFPKRKTANSVFNQSCGLSYFSGRSLSELITQCQQKLASVEFQLRTRSIVLYGRITALC